MTADQPARSGRSRPKRSHGADDFVRRYGPWALVAGASEGLGAAYARALAARGMALILVARREAVLAGLAAELREEAGVEVRLCAGDLSEPSFVEALPAACAGLEVGVMVYNAAHAPVGPFASTSQADLLRAVDVNVRAPLVLMGSFLPPMLARGRGAVVLMTSMAGNQGSPNLAAYAAGKAFIRELAESLWWEARGRNVDVLACIAGAVRTPGYTAAAGKDAPGTLNPEQVVEQALRALGRGPVVIPGRVNRAAAFFMNRVLPRRTAVAIMAGSTADLVPAVPTAAAWATPAGPAVPLEPKEGP